MEPAEILAQIKPCDMENPYVFISYSALDHPQVWEDVLVFQQLGYNIWMDERNLDKTKDSWKEDALAAISDLDCKLLVFYVSRNSLTSENCYDELRQTTEQLTTRIHFGPVPFIAVDIEDVGDIGVFTQQVYEELMCRRIPKKEKTERAIVLSKFTDNFFNSNNERVRVHPKHEPNRKLNYYEEIVASFPVGTKVFDAVIEMPGKKEAEEAKAKVEAEAKAKAEAEAKAKAEAEARAKAEAEAKAKAEAEAKAKAEAEAKAKAEAEAKAKAEAEAKAKAEAEAKAKAEAEEKKKHEGDSVDSTLADQVAALLRRRSDLMGRKAPETPPTPEKDEEEKTPSLEELIRMQLD